MMCILTRTDTKQKGAAHLNYDDKVKNRIKRMEGQLRGILKMMEEEKDCRAVITQLSAVRSGVDRAIGVIVSQNLKDCIMDAKDEAAINDSIEEAVNLFVKSR